MVMPLCYILNRYLEYYADKYSTDSSPKISRSKWLRDHMDAAFGTVSSIHASSFHFYLYLYSSILNLPSLIFKNTIKGLSVSVPVHVSLMGRYMPRECATGTRP